MFFLEELTVPDRPSEGRQTSLKKKKKKEGKGGSEGKQERHFNKRDRRQRGCGASVKPCAVYHPLLPKQQESHK